MLGLNEGEENIMNQNDTDKTAPPVVKKNKPNFFNSFKRKLR